MSNGAGHRWVGLRTAFFLSAWVSLLPGLGNGSTTMRADEPLTSEAAEALFAQRIWPLFVEKCHACHGVEAEDRKAGLDLTAREPAMAGGETGPALVPGDLEESLLVEAVGRDGLIAAMPPKENDRLSAEQVSWIRQWVAAGAPWPDAKRRGELAATARWGESQGVTVATSGGLGEEWTNRRYQPADLWAFQPVKNPEVPAIAEVEHPIDAFLRVEQQRRGLEARAEEADRRTLLRRLTVDLTGLPPTLEEFEAFLADQEEGAYERVVDRLLASPRYGEQQARHWLDVTRYADTSGFSNDFERPNAWRYRDYVIRSFNDDKPYDRFISEQLAGDELNPDDPEMLIAVGYLRMGPWEHTSMTVAAVTRQQYLDDVTQHVGVSLLAQGLRCAACHDHKFDPVPTRDYYRIQSVFATTQFAEREVPFLGVENTSGSAAAREVVQRRLDDLRSKQQELKQRGEDALAEYLKQRGVKRVEDLPEKERPSRDYLGPTQGISQTDLTLRKVYQKQDDYLKRELARFEPLALSVYSGPENQYVSNQFKPGVPKNRKGEPPVLKILTGGSLESPGEEVSPGVLSAVWGSNDRTEPSDWNTITGELEGRRLEFAQWVASESNPLTARVLVNRLWQQHFGRGLVATPNNFGKMGAKPTHPELLDWLASRFMEQGWSIKQMHRLIVTSEAYRMASEPVDYERVAEDDARNELVTYYPVRRMAAEEIRDALLQASGELNLEMGGPGVFPEIHWEVAFQPRQIMGSMAPAYLPSPLQKDRHRRTIYTFRYRTLPDPWLEVLNRPVSEISCERRDETTVSPQVFALFNSEFAANRALAMARSLEEARETEGDRIRLAFLRICGRAPSEQELDACHLHIEKMGRRYQENLSKEEPLPRRIERSMVEELTGETVRWQEDLVGIDRYQRDLMPWEVGPETRALADLCLVLMNSNEFLYLR